MRTDEETIRMSHADAAIVCQKCGFRLKVGRMDTCPNCGAAMLARASGGALVPIVSPSRDKPPLPPDPVPVQPASSLFEKVGNTRLTQVFSSPYLFLRWIVPGGAAVVLGLVKLLTGEEWAVASFYMMAGFAYLFVGLFLWPRS